MPDTNDNGTNERQCAMAIKAISETVYGLSPANRLDIEASVYESFGFAAEGTQRREMANQIREQAQHQATAHDSAPNQQIATILTAIGQAFADAMANVAAHIGPGS